MGEVNLRGDACDDEEEGVRQKENDLCYRNGGSLRV